MTSGPARAGVVSWLPHAGWWGMLSCALAAGLLGNWFLAAGVAAFFLIQLVKPLDFFVAALLVVGGATFLDYGRGNLTFQLSILSAGILFMFFCYAQGAQGPLVSLSRSNLTTPLIAYVLLTTLNAGRGFLVGHPTKHVLLELMPTLALGTSLVIAAAFQPERHIRFALAPLIGVAYGSAALGYHAFAIIGTHMSGVFFQPVPGMVALLVFNLALRARTLAASFGWILAALPLFLHQFLSYRRGLWLGTIAGLILSVILFAPGPSSGRRWRRVGVLGGALLGAGVGGAVALAVIYGQTDILHQASGRFASIGSTELTIETYSNVARLVEYAVVAEHILESPWWGHGLGFTFLVVAPQVVAGKPQWWVHENYLLVWLKQGVIGLVVFLWMLWSGFWLGASHARARAEPFESAWLAATATSTAFMAVFSIADFPFDSAESVFFLALMWGGSMAIAGRGFVRVRWRPLVPGAEPGPHPEPARPQ